MEENNSQTTQVSSTGGSNAWKYGFFVLAAVLIVGAIYVFMGNGSLTGNVIANNPGNGQQPSNIKIDTTGQPMLGSKDAPVTITEFSDFQCPFCGKFWVETYSQIKSNYIDTGKANIVFVQFPLSSIHPAADASANAVLCVFHQYGNDAFWKYHDEIFAQQRIIDSGSRTGAVTKTVTYGVPELKTWAKSLGYNVDECIDSNKYASEVQKDLALGQSAGVSGTPAFVINGQLVSGAQPFANFKTVIDSKLSA